MGADPSLVRPYSWVWYVPSAAMVARRDALGPGFDEDLTLGEDVDLVWRLHDAGWQVRYDPRICVAHEDRIDPIAWYRRRVAYNESVAPLLARHPERVPALFVTPMPALGWAAALGGRWSALVALTAVRGVRLHRTVAGRLPGAPLWAARASAQVTVREGRELGRALAGPWAPFALLAAYRWRRHRLPETTRRAARRRSRGRLDRGPAGARPAQLRSAADRGRVRPGRRHLARVCARP